MKVTSVARFIGVAALLVGVSLFGFSAHADTAKTPVTTGTLVSVSSTTVPSTLVVQSDTALYTVNVTASTTLVRKLNGASLLDEFGVGDTLQITGTASGTTINATRIKNVTIQRINGVQQGTITSINASTMTFVMKSNEKLPQTVTVPDSAKLFKGNLAAMFSDLAVGQTVRVVGLWRRSLHTLTADRVMIKASELNGKVTATNCTATPATLIVSVKKGKTTTAWTITVNDQTVYRDRGFVQIGCAAVSLNDTVRIRGFVTGTMVMMALQLQDSTIKKIQSHWSGTISSNDLTGMTFKLDQKKGVDFTVNTTSQTIVVNGTGTPALLLALANGQNVTVWGVRTGSTIVANLILNATL